MSLGRFDRESGEYVITTPRTPAPWINYLGNLEFGGFIDQAGSALLCRGDPALNRITFWPPAATAGSFKAEALYLRLRAGDGWRVLCPHCLPAMTDPERYECRVGPGWSRYESDIGGLGYEALALVPGGESALVREIRVRNDTGTPVDLDAVPVAEYSHFDALKQLTNADWVPQTMTSEALGLPGGRVVLFQYAFMRKDGPVNWFTASAPASSFETRREAFLGDGGYGSWSMPRSLEAEELPCGQARRGENIAALMLRAGVIPPGGSFAFTTMLGQSDTREAALETIARLSVPGAAGEARDRLARADRGRRSFFRASTPDRDFDDLLNTLLPRQCRVTRAWSRYLSACQTGYGSRGIGFRDSCQDLLAWIPQDPDDASRFLLRLLSFQRSDGSAWHQYNPLSLEASAGDAAEMPDRPQWYGDDHLWAVAAACAYIRETGDLGFLDRTVPYRDLPSEETGSGPVREHLERALAFTARNVGARGLPLLGYADWNDTINLPAGAESCLCACLHGWAAGQLAELYRSAGDEAGAARLEAAREAMRRTFIEAAWDGAWFAAYFRADGTAIGSRSTDGRIFSYAQSWPTIAGFALPGQSADAGRALDRMLLTPYGVKLMAPSYRGYDPSVGGVSTYPPGAKENGGIFVHTNPWEVIASCARGDADGAWEKFRLVDPLARGADALRYRAEPYVFAQNILGDEHPEEGLARNSWLTGAASWSWVAAAERILGIRPEAAGLRVEPCLPASWDGFSAMRRYRGTELAIEARRGGGTSVSLSLDGSPLPGTIVPAGLLSGRRTARLEVTLAAARNRA